MYVVIPSLSAEVGPPHNNQPCLIYEGTKTKTVSKYLRKDSLSMGGQTSLLFWGLKPQGKKINIIGTEEIEQFTISFMESKH